MNSGMKETDNKTVTLDADTDSAGAFEMFLQYSYIGDYFYDEDLEPHVLVMHAQVYILADRLGALPLKELALKKATRQCCNFSVNLDEMKDKPDDILIALLEAINWIYGNTIDGNTGKFPGVEWVDIESSSPSAASTRPGSPITESSASSGAVGKTPKNPRIIESAETVETATPSEIPLDEGVIKGLAAAKTRSEALYLLSLKTLQLQKREVEIKRDGFRLLLAHFAGSFLKELRGQRDFMDIHLQYPEFGGDLLLFLVPGSRASIGEDGYLELKKPEEE
ncbi:hypothetical protein ABW19_dt0209163 [Dactylella cylindrospora]|nr:hypothetical protein ABW19_dt0209163 [Dactylella cylindrospora]